MHSEPAAPWLTWRNPGLLLAGALLTAAAAFVLSSCSLYQALFPPAQVVRRPFNHEAHIVRGVACADCHEGAEKEVRAGMPSKAFCMNCHEDLDKEKDKPLEKKVAWFLNEAGEARWADFGKQKADIKFSHAAHMGKASCLDCHQEMDKNTGLLPAGPQRMTSCIACHQEKATAKLECISCHVSIDRLKKPDNHAQLWMKSHGACAREGAGVATANNCSLCHQPQACTSCHQTVPPQDHTDFWRLRAHGLSAGLDRSRCQTCHTTDMCVACHKTAAPVSHTAGWNAPQEGHCRSCHLPLQSSGSCAVCHRDTPGHAASPPKPPWHTPNMICSSCHAATLKHPDNGDNCNSCHR
jgi:hypothetical protein